MSKQTILNRIRSARSDLNGAGVAPIPRDYLTTRPVPGGAAGLLDRFRERVVDYRAVVDVVPAAEASAAIGRALASLGARQVGVPAGLDPAWIPEGVAVQRDSTTEPLDIGALQRLDAVVTGAAVGIAETGTVVLDGRASCGRRAVHLVPDAHVCVVLAEQVVDDVPAAVARLRDSATQPQTWISGPSATSDIELDRVEGVHGPRQLVVIVLR